MEFNAASSSLWDFSQSPSSFSQLADDDFLVLLQKQFGNNEIPNAGAYTIPHESVDPSKITSLPAPAPPPPLSEDSSPSPPSINDNSSSRRQSANLGSPDQEMSHELKRKASDDAMEDDGPNPKSSKKSSSRRKSTGNSHDESRLMKRKEQNRAAQRAFRERKEKHVKDLEDKVAELEAKNLTTETENQHLKELLKRLQDENVSLKSSGNVSLKNSHFTFSVPRNGESSSDNSFNNAGTSSFTSSPSNVFASTSHSSPSASGVGKAATPASSSSLDTPSNFPADIDFGSLTPFDSSSMNLLDDSGDAMMSYDFGYGQFVPSKTPYKTIASNPMFMSFADPSSADGPLSPKGTPASTSGSQYDMTFGQWTGQAARESHSHTGSIDELFGGHMFGEQSPIQFGVLMRSPTTSSISPAASAMSPVVHQSAQSPPASSTSATTSPDASSSGAGAHGDTCPKTKAQMEQHIQSQGSSIFAPPPPPPQENETRTQIFKAPAGVDGPMIMCKGATFPMTEKSDNNVEVLTAWRSITSHPQFKASNVDINELCSEFTDKARCDGTKVVLDPQGVNSIIEKLTTRLGA
ncbi:hypothetical protein BC834DRAFT_967035 [Gloeopeniophorella convolvens]|nr:hypothetical protein BC834DRAFT_967035 [Gloeopeniophorella convolvens]